MQPRSPPAELSASSDRAYLEQYARNFFDANLDNNIKPGDVTFALNFGTSPTGGNTVRLTANYDQKTIMGKFIGVEDFEMEISATVAAGNRTVEVAIVLDNSGSMDSYTGSTRDTRIERAKIAAENLINSLHSTAALSTSRTRSRYRSCPSAVLSISVRNIAARHGWTAMAGHRPTTRILTGSGTNTRGDPWPNSFKTGDGYKGKHDLTETLGPNPTAEQLAMFSVYSVGTTQWLTRWTCMTSSALTGLAVSRCGHGPTTSPTTPPMNWYPIR
ncbi:MAG: VWA domain-containing protein [Nitratireductor sp.]